VNLSLSDLLSGDLDDCLRSLSLEVGDLGLASCLDDQALGSVQLLLPF